MTSDIPDEAVTAAQEAGNHAYRDGADDATCWRLGLSAALPVLNTAKDSETAEPDLIMGNRPDGSPWVISAEFARTAVRVDSVGVLRLHGKAVSPREAHQLAKGLLAAITWLENDGAAKAEADASQRGER